MFTMRQYSNWEKYRENIFDSVANYNRFKKQECIVIDDNETWYIITELKIIFYNFNNVRIYYFPSFLKDKGDVEKLDYVCEV